METPVSRLRRSACRTGFTSCPIAQEGLGYLIVFPEGNVDTPMLMAALGTLSIVGVILYGMRPPHLL
ncbi:MAG: hypothetical protein V3U27_19350, partial [Candidatus Tectomicrobia bacterium]